MQPHGQRPLSPEPEPIGIDDSELKRHYAAEYRDCICAASSPVAPTSACANARDYVPPSSRPPSGSGRYENGFDVCGSKAKLPAWKPASEQLAIRDLALKESMAQVRHRLDTMTDEERTEVVRLVIDSVLIHSDIVEVVVALDNRVGQATSTAWWATAPLRCGAHADPYMIGRNGLDKNWRSVLTCSI